MIDPARLAIFLSAAFILLITPGPSVAYIVTRSVSQGRRAGMISALGVNTGGLLHVVAAALGLSALLVSSAVAFSVVKYAGALYLIFLGVRAMFSSKEPVQTPAGAANLRALYSQGILVNALNPKTALFFLAFLPQFIDPSRGSAAAQILLLGLLFVGMSVITDGAYALLAGSGRRFIVTERTKKAGGYLAGSVYIALGIAMLFNPHSQRK